MASIRITAFGGLLPELGARLKQPVNAQIAHNCILTDGSLRPQAKWATIRSYLAGQTNDIRGIAYNPIGDVVTMYRSFDPVTLLGEPFAANTTVGASPNSVINRYTTGDGITARTVSVYGDGLSAVITYERSYESIKPVNRLYALSRVRRIGSRTEEGPLIPINAQSTTDILYEGDLVRIRVNSTALDDGANYFRIYRSISGLDTGQAISNELDTEWHLVDEQPLSPGNEVLYVDGNSATALPLDVNYSGQFHPPSIVVRYFGLSEDGWFVSASISGDVMVSERYMHHAWPVENWARIPEEVTDMAVHMNNVYLGTLQRPYVMSLSAGDKAMQAVATPGVEVAPCLPGSMTPAPGGALYASGMGIIALGRDGQQVISRGLINAGDILYKTTTENGREVVAKVNNTNFGAYYRGQYIGFCDSEPLDDGVYFTTTLYPLETQDSMQTSASYRAGPSVALEDNIRTGAMFTGGDLRRILSGYVMPADEDGTGPVGREEGLHIRSGAMFTGGSISTILVTNTVLPDNVAPLVSIVSGELRTILVSNTMTPDNVSPLVSIIEGRLE